MHKVKITSPDGMGILTTVTLDGEKLLGVTFVGLSIDLDRNVQVTLRLIADVEFEGDAEVVRQWRSLRRREQRSRQPGVLV
jgi:hypothetical protein